MLAMIYNDLDNVQYCRYWREWTNNKDAKKIIAHYLTNERMCVGFIIIKIARLVSFKH
jgi:hypothetical protein